MDGICTLKHTGLAFFAKNSLSGMRLDSAGSMRAFLLSGSSPGASRFGGGGTTGGLGLMKGCGGGIRGTCGGGGGRPVGEKQELVYLWRSS